MKLFNKSIAVLAAPLLFTIISGNVQAGATQALASCKKQILGDERLAAYENVSARMDKMQRRGRYTNYSIDVKATAADGAVNEWQAQCKARDSGRVESLELAEKARTDKLEVASGS